MQVVDTDVVVVGGGGAGLRAAIAVAERDAALKVALVSKVVPMRSHTVAAEGGSAGVVRPDDSLDNHFDDTVSGGDWLCDQDVVEYFVAHCTAEMTQLEHWGCPWSRKAESRLMAEQKTIEIEVLRYDPKTDREPHYQSFRVPFSDDMSVLQGLQHISYHAYTWWKVSPKTDLRLGRKEVPQSLISAGGWAATLAATVVVIALVAWSSR